MNAQKISKALYAGVGAGVAAFVTLGSGVSKWAIAADFGVAIATGIFTAVVTYASPANKPDGEWR